MRGLEYLFKSWLRWKWCVFITAAMFVGLLVVCCVGWEELGSEDYLMPMAFLPIVPYCVLVMATTVGFVSINGCRLIRSSPIAKELYTRSVPLFIIGLTLGSLVIAVGVFFVVVIAHGASAAYFSDTLIFMGIGSGINIISYSLLSRMMFGGVFGVYLTFPYVGMILVLSEDIKRNGFGLPVWVSALIFAGALIVSSVISFIVCGIYFRKLNFKTPATAYATK
ncbi:MAG: hypothetical protein K2G32_02725, partial [Oscillospiraceae bacterium]|nr:hypothetical protein [Oscillospiraceae bacterium]